jgi:hypothetical protein
VARHQVRAQRRVVVLLEVGPVERDHDLLADADHEPDPRLEDDAHVEARVAQQPIDLLDPTLGLDVGDLRVRLADGVDGQRRRVQHADDAVGEGQYARRVHIRREDVLDEGLDVRGIDLHASVLGRPLGGRGIVLGLAHAARTVVSRNKFHLQETNQGIHQGSPRS